jgi:protein SCO1/2
LRFIWFALSVFSLLAAIVPAQRVEGKEERGEGLYNANSSETAAEYFTNLPLITHQGKTIRFFDDLMADRVVLLTGFYINCTTICPQQNLVLSRLQDKLGDRLGKEVELISVSVDPKRDTPEKVTDYARVFRPKPGWTFLTGKPENIDWVNYKLGQYYEDPELHRGIYLLGNLKTGLWKKLKPDTKADELLQQIETMLNDKGEKN